MTLSSPLDKNQDGMPKSCQANAVELGRCIIARYKITKALRLKLRFTKSTLKILTF